MSTVLHGDASQRLAVNVVLVAVALHALSVDARDGRTDRRLELAVEEIEDVLEVLVGIADRGALDGQDDRCLDITGADVGDSAAHRGPAAGPASVELQGAIEVEPEPVN